jgi:hypothetical protein
MSFSKQLAIVFGFTFLGIVFFLVSSFLIGKNLQAKAQKITLLEKEISFRNKALKSIAVLKRDYQEAQPYFESVNNFLPTKDQLINFSRDLNSLANQQKVNLTFNLNDESATPLGSSNFLVGNNFELTVNGSTENTLSFLRLLIQGRYFFYINSLVISYSRENLMNASLKGQIIFLEKKNI